MPVAVGLLAARAKMRGGWVVGRSAEATHIATITARNKGKGCVCCSSRVRFGTSRSMRIHVKSWLESGRVCDPDFVRDAIERMLAGSWQANKTVPL
jgi:hypothetical protein